MSAADESTCPATAGGLSPQQGLYSARAERPAARYALWEMLAATAVLAVVLAIVRACGTLGAVACTLAAHLLTWVIYPRLRPSDRFAQEVQYDLTWGLVMPVVFFLVDPLVFKPEGSIWSPAVQGLPPQDRELVARLGGWGYFAYAFAGWQMATLAAWLLLRKRSGRLAAFLTGSMFVGLQFIAVVGVFLMPAAALGLLPFGVGIVFATPAMMAWSLARSLMDAELVAWRQQPEWQAWSLAIAGGAMAVIGPGIIGLTADYIALTASR